MEAPEKIYFSGQQQYSNPFIGLMQKCADTDIEYTRTDAITDKVENFLEMLGGGFTITDNITHTNYDKKQLIEDFKNYMKEGDKE